MKAICIKSVNDNGHIYEYLLNIYTVNITKNINEGVVYIVHNKTSNLHCMSSDFFNEHFRIIE